MYDFTIGEACGRMVRILVFGVDHTTQETGTGNFLSKLQYLIDRYAVQAVLEEWRFGENGTAAFTEFPSCHGSMSGRLELKSMKRSAQCLPGGSALSSL